MPKFSLINTLRQPNVHVELLHETENDSRKALITTLDGSHPVYCVVFDASTNVSIQNTDASLTRVGRIRGFGEDEWRFMGHKDEVLMSVHKTELRGPEWAQLEVFEMHCAMHVYKTNVLTQVSGAV